MKVQKDTQFAVLGLGKFGRSLARTLYTNGYDVLCCDRNEQLVADATDYATLAVQADITDDVALEKIGMRNMDVVIVATSSDFEASVVTSMILKEMDVPFIMAKANDRRQKRILETLGVNRVVLPENEMGQQVAFELISDNLLDYIHGSEDYHILEMRPQADWVGKSIEELALRPEYGINVLAIVRDHHVQAVLPPDTVLQKDDNLVVLKKA